MAGENLKVSVGADLSGFTKGLKEGERGYATFRDRIGATSESVAKHLETTGRHWTRTSRELGRIGKTTTEALAGLGASAGGVADAFKLSGQSAELFAGVSGLGGIALQVATGGPLMAGLAAVAALIALTGRNAEKAKAQLEGYTAAIKKELSPDEMKLQQSALQGTIGGVQARIAQLKRTNKLTTLASMGEGGGAQVIGSNDQAIAQATADLKTYQAQLQAVTDALNEAQHEADVTARHTAEDHKKFLASPEGRLKTFSDSVGVATEQVKGLAKQLKEPPDTIAKGETMMQRIDTWLAGLKDKAGDAAKQLQTLRNALGEALQAAHLEEFERIAKSGSNIGTMFAGAQVASIVARQAISGMPTQAPIATHDLSTNSGVSFMLGNGGKVSDSLRKLDNLHEAEQQTKQAITEGLNALPQALSGVLLPMVSQLLGSVFGSGRGAQMGGALGSAFGGGAGAYLGGLAAKSIGGVTGSLLGSAVGSVVPIIGTAIGGLLGAGIGSLFGHHKKAVEDNTSALQAQTDATKHLSEQISNLPAGIKVERYRYGATTPVDTGGGSGTGGTGGGTTGGGPGVQQSVAPTTSVTIQQVVVNGVTDVASLVKKIGDHVQAQVYRGGSTPLRTAFAR